MLPMGGNQNHFEGATCLIVAVACNAAISDNAPRVLWLLTSGASPSLPAPPHSMHCPVPLSFPPLPAPSCRPRAWSWPALSPAAMS